MKEHVEGPEPPPAPDPPASIYTMSSCMSLAFLQKLVPSEPRTLLMLPWNVPPQQAAGQPDQKSKDNMETMQPEPEPDPEPLPLPPDPHPEPPGTILVRISSSVMSAQPVLP